MPERDDLIRQWAAEGLSEDEIVQKLKREGPVRSFLRGLPGYGAARSFARGVTERVTHPVETAKDVYRNLGAGIASTTLAVPEGAFRLAGMSERADVIGAERERIAGVAGPPEGLLEGASRFGGIVAPYVITGMAAGPTLPAQILSGAALDVPVAAAGREMSVAGMVADYTDPMRDVPTEIRPPFEDPAREAEFQGWYRGRAEQLGLNPNPDDPLHQYDYRRAFEVDADTEMGADGLQHWPSEFKLRDHPNLIVDGNVTATGEPARGSLVHRIAGRVAESPALRGLTEAGLGAGITLGAMKGLPVAARAITRFKEPGDAVEAFARNVGVIPGPPSAARIPDEDVVESFSRHVGEIPGPGRTPGPQDVSDDVVEAYSRYVGAIPEEGVGKPNLPGPQILYRGSPTGTEGAFYSPDESVARSYAGDSGTVTQVVVEPKNPLRTANWQDAKNALDLPRSATMPDLIEAARSAGHDWLIFSTKNGVEYVQTSAINIGKPDLAGFAHPSLVGPLAGATGGAAIGAGTAEEGESPVLRGLAGAALGAGAGFALTGMRQAADDVSLTGLREAPARPNVTPSQYALRKAEEVNLPSFNLDASGTDRLQRHIARIVEVSEPEHLRQRPVSWEETKSIAADLGLSPSDLDKVAASRMTGAETLAVRDLVAQNIDDLTTLENRLLTGLSDSGMPLTRGDIEETTRLVNALEAQNDTYLRKFLRARSEAGRNLNNLKIIANRTLDPATWLAKAEKIKGSPLDEFQGRQLRRLLASGDRLEVAKYVGSLYDAPMSEKLVTLWKAGLLSNPATHIGNMVGNFTMATLETLKDAPAALFDRIASTISDVRAKGGISADVIRAGWDAVDAKGAARQVITGDMLDTSMLAKYDVQRQVSFDKWPAGVFLNAYAGPRSRIFASLGAGDKIFRGFALGRSLMEQATLMAKAEGLAGAELAARIDELIDTDAALHARAIVDSEVATFLNRGSHTTFKGVDLAAAGEGLRRHLGPVGQVIAPFVRTPANIMDRVLEYSPVGYLADLPKMADWLQKIRQGASAAPNGLGAQDLAELMYLQREMVEQAGRATIGTAAITMGYVLADRGLLTGNYPEEAAERNVHELLNKQPHSLLVDGHWLSLDRVSPLGNLLTLGAEVQRMSKNPELGIGGAAMAVPGVVGKTVVEQSFLRGVQGALEAVSAPERSMSQWVRNTVASAVPAAVYASARALDPVVRDPQTIGEAVRARLPGLSETVAPRISAFGEERTRDPSVAGRIGQVVSPFTMRGSEADDPVKAEVERVTASIAPYRPRGIERGTSEYTDTQVEYGEETKAAVERAIRSGEYDRLGRRAASLVERNAEYQGRTVEDVTAELMAEHIENEVRQARSDLTERRRGRQSLQGAR